jgi:hypothetical protein
MKRILIVVALCIVIWFGYTVVTNGVDNNKLNLNILGYKSLEEESDSLTKAVEAYNTKNQDTYDQALVTLNNSIKKYNESKAKYEEVIAELATTDDTSSEEEEPEVTEIISPIKTYEINFILTVLQNYADKEGVDIVVSTETSSSSDTTSAYIYCNLKFTVKGAYISISDFIADIEQDDRLGFEINSFSMTSGSATFTAKNIPLNSSTIITSSSLSSSSSDLTTSDSSSEDTEDSNTITDDTDDTSSGRVSSSSDTDNTVQ